MNSDTILTEAGRHFIDDSTGTIAEMTYTTAGEKAIIIDSTYVRDDHRGQGLGKRLLDSVVAQARAEGKKIVPLCPFAKAQFDKHQEYQSVAAQP